MPCYNNMHHCTPKPEPRPMPDECTNHTHHIHTHLTSLAVAMVNDQPYNSCTYDLCTAFMNGTIYPDLNKPFLGRGGCCK